jgi:glycosyltransferase involved in cell wall biosynthesis
MHTIRETIESVRQQNYPNLEHIVMDGGSKDGTLDILKAYPHLKSISEKDQGLYDAMNKGVAFASGDLIVILNADDCFRPGVLEKVAMAFQAHPEWDALFADVIFVDAEGREIYRREEAIYDYDVMRYALDYVCHQTLFVKRAVYERIGNYRQQDFLSAADYEFKLRMGKLGCRIGHLPEYVVNYRYHSRGMSADKRMLRITDHEMAAIRREYGNAGGWRGKLLSVCFKAKRQFQKLCRRGKVDLIPGTWILRRHYVDKAQIPFNSGVDKL